LEGIDPFGHVRPVPFGDAGESRALDFEDMDPIGGVERADLPQDLIEAHREVAAFPKRRKAFIEKLPAFNEGLAFLAFAQNRFRRFWSLKFISHGKSPLGEDTRVSQ
jgi:hypothetical protein